MAYKLTEYTKSQAKRLDIQVKPSTVKGKKIDIFKNGKKIGTAGALGYNDFPTYLELERKGKYPKGYADKRRVQYKVRHEKDRHKVGSNGYWADNLLW